MSKFNTAHTRPRTTSPVQTETVASSRTYEGGAGHLRGPQSELFLLAVTNMVGEDTFYERASDRDDRFSRLVRQCYGIDPGWTARLIRWLRAEANIRTAAVVAAVEYTVEHLMHFPDGIAPVTVPSPRSVIDSACQRADEPGEVLAFYMARYGRKVPKPVKRGVADAVGRLYNQHSLLKYDAAGKGFRFGDVIELVHPTPHADKPWQGDLFRHAIDRRHQRDNETPETLGVLRARDALMSIPVESRRGALSLTATLASAGMTWEALSGWLQGPMDRHAWEAIIPTMGYMALLRNLRNFDEAGVCDAVAADVCRTLADPDEVARSRQLPFRFYSAYRAAPSLRWGHALETALGLSLANIPALPGRTLILVDTSGSMHAGFSKDGTLMRWDAAALFGIALGQRCAAADVISFAQGYAPFPLTNGGSVLRDLDKWKTGGWFLNGGTATAACLRATYEGHDRVVILTDEQAARDPIGPSGSVPAHVPSYVWNLAGYRPGMQPSGAANRHTFGGLTDHAFRMIPLLEASRSCAWPF